jgi:hypothetical protein
VTASVYTWNELTAEYLPHERELILALASGGHRLEAEFVHELKATFDGTLDEEATTTLDRGSVTSGEYPRGESAAESSVVAEPAASSSSVPTGHGSFAIPKGIQAKLASKRGQSVR